MAITNCLWFDTEADEAANFYARVFRGGKVNGEMVYGEATKAVTEKPVGSTMAVTFEIEGQSFLALNGGTKFSFNQAVSFMVYRDTQEEIDELWDALTSKGGTESQCGWCSDRFGVSWQVLPSGMMNWTAGPDPAGRERAIKAMLTMRKINIAEIKAAYEGEAVPG